MLFGNIVSVHDSQSTLQASVCALYQSQYKDKISMMIRYSKATAVKFLYRFWTYSVELLLPLIPRSIAQYVPDEFPKSTFSSPSTTTERIER